MAVDRKAIGDIIQWDVHSWSRALYYWDNHLRNMRGPLKALELGGWSGGLSLWLAMNNVAVICSDVADAKARAYPLHHRYGVDARISYRDIDATSIPYQDEFDIVVFKSIVGGIGRSDGLWRQGQVFTEIRKALKPGGVLFFAENLLASPLHCALRKRWVKWGTRWGYMSVRDIEECLAGYASMEINTTGVLATFGRREWQRRALGILDSIVLNRLWPPSWRYIAYGMARK